MTAEEGGEVIGYMCAVDWEFELGAASGGNRVFPSKEDALKHLKCGKSCGIVEVEVRYRSLALQGTSEVTSREELASALQPTPMSVAEAWQPIDTAPKDTKARLIWCPSNRCVFCACWEKGGTPGYKAGWAVFGGGWRECLQGATHWMPLPEPPALASPEGE